MISGSGRKSPKLFGCEKFGFWRNYPVWGYLLGYLSLFKIVTALKFLQDLQNPLLISPQTIAMALNIEPTTAQVLQMLISLQSQYGEEGIQRLLSLSVSQKPIPSASEQSNAKSQPSINSEYLVEIAKVSMHPYFLLIA